MKKILILIGFLYSINSFSQSTVLLRGDTTKVYKQGGEAILKVEGQLILNNYKQGNSNDSVLTWDATTKKVRMMDRSSFGSSGGLGVLDTLVNPKWRVVQDAAGDTYKSHAPSVFYAADFGVKADGVTDDWTGIMAALQAAFNAGGGDVILPLGVMLTSRTIKFPLDEYTDAPNIRSIRLLGQSVPNMFSNPLSPITFSTYGSIIQGTFLGDSAVINTFSSSGGWGDFNFLNITIENFHVKVRSLTAGTPVSIAGQGINAIKMANVQIKNVAVTTTGDVFNSVQPASTSAGIIMPAVNNFVIPVFITELCYLSILH